MALTLVAVLAVAGIAQEKGGSEQVDQAEVLRRGDLVQHVDGYRADADDLVAEAMRPPESDADKWFISVLTDRGCASCERLKEDWKESRHLRALAVPGEPKKSWAHWNTYSATDKSQAHRFEKLKVAGYPTILVQPPRNGEYGPPSTVVFQETGYDGDDKKLARAMASAVKAYIASRQRESNASEPVAVGAAPDYGVAPPWDPDRDESYLPAVDGRRPVRIPPIEPDVNERALLGGIARLLWAALIKLLLWVIAFAGVIAGIALLVLYIRNLRKEAGKKPIISDEQLADLVDLLRKSDTPASETKKAL